MGAKRVWTPEMDFILREGYGKGETYAEIAVRLGLDAERWRKVSQRRYALGLTRPDAVSRQQRSDVGKRGGQNQRAFWTDSDVEKLRWAAKTYTQMPDVMEHFPGRSYNSVSSKMLKLGLNLNQKEPEPEPEIDQPPPPAFKPPGMPISLPNRPSATPVPDLDEWRKRRDAMRRRLEADGGNLNTLRRNTG